MGGFSCLDYQTDQKGRPKRPDRYPIQAALGLLDFGFLELNMLAHDGVIFAERHLFGDVARIFLGHVEKARVSSAEQLNLDRGWLRHGPFLLFKKFRKKLRSKKAALFTDGRQCGFAGLKSSQ
jgi:hypothetical protein